MNIAVLNSRESFLKIVQFQRQLQNNLVHFFPFGGEGANVDVGMESVAYPLCSTVLMLKPNVGDIWVMSSPINFFRMVVFPALSRPLNWREGEVGGEGWRGGERAEGRRKKGGEREGGKWGG